MTPGRRSRPGAPRVPFAVVFSTRALQAIALLLLASGAPAFAAPIANPVAGFSGLDKITARVTHFDAYINETVQFGSLQITPRACYTHPDTEAQRTSVFVEVDQVSLKGDTHRVFTGWMFADSPALNAVDNAVYDFWLVACKQQSRVPPPSAAAAPPPKLPPGKPAISTAGQPAAAPPANAATAVSPSISMVPAATADSIGALIDPTPTAQRPAN